MCDPQIFCAFMLRNEPPTIGALDQERVSYVDYKRLWQPALIMCVRDTHVCEANRDIVFALW